MVRKKEDCYPCHMPAFAVVVSLLNVVRAYMAIWAPAAGGCCAVPCSNDALTSLNVKWGRVEKTVTVEGKGGRTKNRYTAKAVHHLELPFSGARNFSNDRLSEP